MLARTRCRDTCFKHRLPFFAHFAQAIRRQRVAVLEDAAPFVAAAFAWLDE